MVRRQLSIFLMLYISHSVKDVFEIQNHKHCKNVSTKLLKDNFLMDQQNLGITCETI